MKKNESESVSPSVLSDSFPHYGCIPPGSSVHRNGISPDKNTGVMGMQTSTATMENSVEIPLKIANRTAL